MTGAYDSARAACAELPEARLTYPFGEQPAVFKVGGRVFALLTEGPGPGSPSGSGAVSVKAEPDYAATLVATHGEVVPGYHLNKRHWITVDLGGTLPEQLVCELVEDSYDLVVSGLPKKDRPYLAEHRH